MFHYITGVASFVHYYTTASDVEQMMATSFSEEKWQAAASNSSLTLKYTEIKHHKYQ